MERERFVDIVWPVGILSIQFIVVAVHETLLPHSIGIRHVDIHSYL
jgi:hypothetical protein